MTTLFARQTKCCVHRHLQLRWNRTLTRGDAIIVWVCQETRCHQHKENVLVCGPKFYFLQWIENYKFPLTNDQATPNYFEVWNIFDGQVNKCHMGWILGCKIFCGQFNQNVIWKNVPWHVWTKSRNTKNYSTCHAYIDGASIQLDYT